MNESGEVTVPDALVRLLRSARHVAVLTGAGISAESGIPTFREAQTGLWARYDPAELASPEAFSRNPQLVWNWYAWRRSLVRNAAPNPGHRALVTMAARVGVFTLITQNVDGLHQRAGNADVIELHGSLMRNRCFREGVIMPEMPESEVAPPVCPQCGAYLRPDVVWFGEALPQAALAAAFEAAQTCDLFFSIGTSALVHPAASLPVEALRQGVPTVEVNPTATPLTPHVDFALAGPAGVVLPSLVQKTWPELPAQ